MCTLEINSDAKKSIVVWGDLHAAGWSAALEKIAGQQEFSVNIASIPGCPPIVGVRQSPGILDRSNCDRL